jgi:exoribonuclease R
VCVCVLCVLRACSGGSERLVVRIDQWRADQRLPSGHVVRRLGAVGSLETELMALLIEVRNAQRHPSTQ